MRFLNSNDFDNLQTNEHFINECAGLYSSNNGVEYQLGRYKKLYSVHVASNKANSDVLAFSSPGRIEVCGNHTDHNNGKVLCASISVDTVALVTPLDSNFITVASVGYPPVVVNIDDLAENPAEHGRSEGLVRGVCAYLKNTGLNIGGFYATTTSDVFKGAGVSSSACFEVLIAEILNVLYNDSKIDSLTKAYAAHHAEFVFFGKPCGLLDQSAIAIGGVSYIDFKDNKSPQVEGIDWHFDDDVDIILVNCGGDHCGLTNQYAAIRTEMEDVAKVYGKTSLRFCEKSTFYNDIPKLQDKVSGRAILRGIHFFEENDRVATAADAVRKDDIATFLAMINASGESSYKLLQNCYPEGDKTMRIPLALALSRSICGENGGIRVHGGGFAGTMIAYIPKHYTAEMVSKLSQIFGNDNVFEIAIRNSGTKMLNI